MRRPPVRRDHAERPARPRSQRRGLHGADAGPAIFLQIPRAGHEVARLDVGHEHALVVAERPAAGAPRSDVHPLPERRGVRVEVLPREERQRRVVCGEHLDAGRVGRHQLHRRAENLRVQGFWRRLRNQAGADRLERFCARHLACQPLLALPKRGLTSDDVRERRLRQMPQSKLLRSREAGMSTAMASSPESSSVTRTPRSEGGSWLKQPCVRRTRA